MNGYPPTHIQTRNEIIHLSNVGRWFISFKTSTPSIGAFQDALIGLFELTRDSVKIDRFHAMHMLNAAELFKEFDSKKQMYNGRDIVSIALPDINFVKKSSFLKSELAPYMGTRYKPSEVNIEIDRGNFKTGVLAKNAVGQDVVGTLIHIIHNEYGANKALEVTYKLQQLATTFLLNGGFSIGMADVLLNNKSLEKVHQIASNIVYESYRITQDLRDGKIIPPIGSTVQEFYEAKQIANANPGDDFIEPILESVNPDTNNLLKLIISGSKGKFTNLYSISSSMGLQTIGGERLELSFGYKRANPYSHRFSDDPTCRGHIANSLLAGLNSEEFLAAAMEARFGIINRSLSTSITGYNNRKSIKALDGIMVNNTRSAAKGSNIIQFLYGEDGIDARMVEQIKFPTIDMTFKDIDEKYHAKPSDFTYKSKDLKSVLDKEYEQILTDRQNYIDIFLRMERQDKNYTFTDEQKLPVNCRRIISDTIYDLQLQNNKTKINPITAIQKVQELCEDLPYLHTNYIQQKKRTRLPEHIKSCAILLNISIRTELCTKMLLKHKLTDKALDIVISKIKLTYRKSLVDYGMSVGLIAAQCVSEPMTQLILDSHHRSGAGGDGAESGGLTRANEIYDAKDTDKMESPTISAMLKPEFRNDKARAEQIANYIQEHTLRDFTIDYQILLEEYGKARHKLYQDDNTLFDNFKKHNPGLKPPSDITNWCFRININRMELYIKSMSLETIVDKLYHTYRDQIFIVHTPENANKVIMRIYLRGSFNKGNINEEIAEDFIEVLLDTVVRGISGIKQTHIVQKHTTHFAEDGAKTSEKEYYLFTTGVNMKDMMDNPYLDTYNIQTTSILEIARVYGIEAARKRIVSEMDRLLGDKSIYRHYSIYADEMTFTGTVTNIARAGIEKREAHNLLLRMSNQAPIQTLEEAAANAMTDNIEGVSAPIMVGRSPYVGSLYNTFYIDEEFIHENVQSIDDTLDQL